MDNETCSKMAQDYKRHLADILPDLPPEVQTLATSINIHDGLLREKAKADLGQTILRLVLRCGDSQIGYFDLELRYAEVNLSPQFMKDFAQLSAILMTKNQPPYPSEALYQEVDREGQFLVHRILFSQTDRKKRQAQRRLRRQLRTGMGTKRHRLRFRGGEYQELAITFKKLRIWTTPREGRYSAK